MSTFTPDQGTLFYAECTRVIVQGGSAIDILLGGTATVEKTRDRSYSDTIFRAVATDARMVVGDIVRGGYGGNKRVMLQRADFKFMPVGPEVAAAMGLENGEDGDA